jgi:hypothetical protein
MRKNMTMDRIPTSMWMIMKVFVTGNFSHFGQESPTFIAHLILMMARARTLLMKKSSKNMKSRVTIKCQLLQMHRIILIIRD